MPRAAIAICLLLSFLLPARAAERTIQLSVSLDWKGFSGPMALAGRLQEKRLFPLPMLYVAGKLRGLVPSTLSIDLAGGSARMEVGVAQVIERPLYNIEISRNSAGSLAVQIELLDLSMVPDYSIADRSGPAVLLDRVTRLRLEIPAHDGVYSLPLPAAPLLALVEYASKTYHGMALGHVVPLVLKDPHTDRRYPPVTTLPTSSFANANFQLALPVNAPAIYADTIAPAWFDAHASSSAQAGFTSIRTFRAGFFVGPLLPRLRLKSQPSGAEIVINGILQSPPVTDTVVPAARSVWGDIVLRKGMFDCPVDTTQVTRATGRHADFTFTCKLKKD